MLSRSLCDDCENIRVPCKKGINPACPILYTHNQCAVPFQNITHFCRIRDVDGAGLPTPQ